MKAKKIIVMLMVASCFVFTGCGNQQQNNANSATEETQSEVIFMYEGYDDIPDFGKTYGIEANVEKAQLMSMLVDSTESIIKVYDVPEKQKLDVEEWELKLTANGFEMLKPEEGDDYYIHSYLNASGEIVVSSLGKSTAEEGGYVFTIIYK